MGKLYEIILEKEKKTLFVRASGFFKEEDTKLYLSEFQTIVNTINPSIYKLIVDASEQEAVEPHVIIDIKFVLNLYSNARFKKLVIINSTSPASKEQIDNCTKEMDFKCVFASSVEEAYNL
ncbi:hypothetical protein [Bacillus salipaludis]|uniref:STAS domain-containing protein n=1 Tax=Bacillus salipaludis TaxID=2547811 RepID=A0ABW8RMS5_9BACI